MGTFASYDGVRLAYHVVGGGPPLICLPGGPGRASAYLGDLGGLSRHRQVVLLDHRGTGDSAVPPDPASYRCDRLADDVDALRAHLGLDQLDLLGHSAGGNTAIVYAGRYPDRVSRLILLTPGMAAAGLDQPDEESLAVARRRSSEPWYAQAMAALDAMVAGKGTPELQLAAAPFFYGRWDEAAAAHAAAAASQTNPIAAAGFDADGAFDTEATRLGLTKLSEPVLVYAGDADPSPTPRSAGELAALFRRGSVSVHSGGGHFPWLDDPARFVRTITDFVR
jgi:pimeloyl-ACP methyl ester carboxylesterase